MFSEETFMGVKKMTDKQYLILAVSSILAVVFIVICVISYYPPQTTVNGDTTQTTFYLGDQIFVHGHTEYYFHGFMNDTLVIAHYPFYRGGMSNIYTNIENETTFQLNHRKFTILELTHDSITLSWE